jgi:hypothetical protein
MSRFDNIQKAAFTKVQDIFGDVAVWIPSQGGDAQTVNVLFKSPDKEKMLGDTEKYKYTPYKYSIEYYIDQFIGLKDSVEDGNTEVVTIDSVEFYVKSIIGERDGKTYVVELEPNE